ncbi:hypothetical protein KCG44_05530 [Pacificimonas sp. WHA3]|uniref:Uncharacterized protein n=1 Tax=Pacificimonas pallii TaxID=2827236 RepID=A0ABS6SCV1_9SPHN|nr:hypothetical protein [Pacificimonas pallii]MBV7256243.1 hypothetical protein [Pacificimonas pallii]
MFNAANDTSIIRNFAGMIAAAVLTVTVFYGAAGPDPRAGVYTSIAAADAAPANLA